MIIYVTHTSICNTIYFNQMLFLVRNLYEKISENKMKLKYCTACADVWALNTFHHAVSHFGASTFNELGTVLLLPFN